MHPSGVSVHLKHHYEAPQMVEVYIFIMCECRLGKISGVTFPNYIPKRSQATPSGPIRGLQKYLPSQLTCNQRLQRVGNIHSSANGCIHIVEEISIDVTRIEVGGFARVDDRSTTEGNEGVKLAFFGKPNHVHETVKNGG